MGLGTGACSFGSVEKSQRNEIDVGGVEIEGRGSVGVSRIEEERESEEDDGESDGCDGPIPLRPLSPPSQSAKPRIYHWKEVFLCIKADFCLKFFVSSIFHCLVFGQTNKQTQRITQAPKKRMQKHETASFWF